MPQLLTAADVHGCSHDFPGCHTTSMEDAVRSGVAMVERCDTCWDERARVRFEGDLEAAWSVKAALEARGVTAVVRYHPAYCPGTKHSHPADGEVGAVCDLCGDIGGCAGERCGRTLDPEETEDEDDDEPDVAAVWTPESTGPDGGPVMMCHGTSPWVALV